MTMNLSRRAMLAVAAAALAACASLPPDPQTVLARADAAMGASALRTLSYAGSGTGAVFGQAWRPGAGVAPRSWGRCSI